MDSNNTLDAKDVSKPNQSEISVNRYLIDGNLPLGLWKFALPFMLAYILQALYGAVDLLIVGRYCDPGAISAVATGSQILLALTGLVFGLAEGGVALIAFTIGARDSKGTAHALGSCASIFVLVALIATPILIFATNWLVEVLQTPMEAVTGAQQYIFAIACGLPFLIGYNYVGAIYRGLGDSVTPTLFVAIACIANVLGDLLLVAHYKMGPLGAAIATDMALGLSFLCAIIYIRKKSFPVEFHRRHFAFDKESVKKILNVGIPLSLQDGFTSISFLVITGIINSMGVMQSAGMGVADRVIGFMLLPPLVFSNAVTTATAQNFGAGLHRRAFMSFVWGFSFSFIFGFIFWVLCQLLPTEIASLFTTNEEIARQGGLYLRSFSLDCMTVAFIFTANGYFCGLGKSMVVFIHSTIATFLARIPLSYAFSRMKDASLYKVGFASPLASCLSVLVCVLYMLGLLASMKKKCKDQ